MKMHLSKSRRICSGGAEMRFMVTSIEISCHLKRRATGVRPSFWKILSAQRPNKSITFLLRMTPKVRILLLLVSWERISWKLLLLLLLLLFFFLNQKNVRVVVNVLWLREEESKPVKIVTMSTQFVKMPARVGFIFCIYKIQGWCGVR